MSVHNDRFNDVLSRLGLYGCVTDTHLSIDRRGIIVYSVGLHVIQFHNKTFSSSYAFSTKGQTLYSIFSQFVFSFCYIILVMSWSHMLTTHLCVNKCHVCILEYTFQCSCIHKATYTFVWYIHPSINSM